MNPTNQAGTVTAISNAQAALLKTVSGIDARQYAEALRGLFAQVAMFAPVTEQVQDWLIDVDALAALIEAIAAEQKEE